MSSPETPCSPELVEVFCDHLKAAGCDAMLVAGCVAFPGIGFSYDVRARRTHVFVVEGPRAPLRMHLFVRDDRYAISPQPTQWPEIASAKSLVELAREVAGLIATARAAALARELQ